MDSFVIVTAPGRDCGFSDAVEAAAAAAEEVEVQPELTAPPLFSFGRAGDMVTFPPGGTILSRFEADFSFDLSVSHADSFAALGTGDDAFGGQGFPGIRFGGGSAFTSLAFLAAGDAAAGSSGSSRALFILDTSLFSPAAAAEAEAVAVVTGACRLVGVGVLPPTVPQPLPAPAPGPPPPPL